jgi:hypothetical protein
MAARFPGKLHDRGGTAKDNRRFINAVIWIRKALQFVPRHCADLLCISVA